MFRCVPPAAGKVHASCKSQRVVNQDDLLVMAGARGMTAVKLEMNPWVPKRVSSKNQLRFPNVGEEDRKAPTENVDVELGIRSNESGKQVLQRPQPPVPFFSEQERPAVKIPAYDRDGTPGQVKTLRQRSVVVGPVNQKGEAVCLYDLPAIPARLECGRHILLPAGLVP
jgi:hypothetical protein